MTLTQFIGYLFLIFLGVLWTRAGYMDRDQAKGITNILFYVLLPFMLLQYSQTEVYTSPVPAGLITAAVISIVLAALLTLLDRLPLFEENTLLGTEFRLLPVTAAILIGAILSFSLYRFRVTLPFILSSPLSMLCASVVPVAMFLIGNAIACASRLRKGGRK